MSKSKATPPPEARFPGEKEMISFRISTSLKTALGKIANEYNVSVSDVVTHALSEYADAMLKNSKRKS
jgi:hypothetical protein